MMLQSKSILTQKHARIITLGDFKSTDEIWGGVARLRAKHF